MGMSIEKATEPSAAEMLSTMEVRVRMLPCSGESAALSRSASQRQKKKTTINKHWLHFQLHAKVAMSFRRTHGCETCAHPRCCSSACTAPGCCSTRGCCSRCCRSWARWMTTPVAMEMHRHTHTQGQKLLSFTRQPRSRTPHCVFLRHPPSRQRTS